MFCSYGSVTLSAEFQAERSGEYQRAFLLRGITWLTMPSEVSRDWLSSPRTRLG